MQTTTFAGLFNPREYNGCLKSHCSSVLHLNFSFSMLWSVTKGIIFKVRNFFVIFHIRAITEGIHQFYVYSLI